MLGLVSQSVFLTRLLGWGERFAFGNGPLLSPGVTALGTNDFVLPRVLRYVARFQKWFFGHAFHLLPGVNLARVHTPQKEKRGRIPYSSFPAPIIPVKCPADFLCRF